VPVPPHPLEVPEYQGNTPLNKSRDNKKQSEQKEIKDLKRDVKF